MNALPDLHASASVQRKPLRLMPGIVLAALLVLVRFVLPAVVPDGELRDTLELVGALGAVAGALLIILWWLFLSRAPWSERLGAIAVMAIAMFVTRLVLHPSIAGGMMGFMFYAFATPLLALALVAWAVASRRSSQTVRRVSMVVILFVVCGAWALARTEGLNGGKSELRWRWSMTPEERLLAQGGDASQPLAPVPAIPEPANETAAVRPAAAVAATGTASTSEAAVPVVDVKKAEARAVDPVGGAAE